MESVFEKAIAIEFANSQLPFYEQKNFPVKYQSIKLTDYRPDFIVDDKIAVDLKRGRRINIDDFDQLERYIKRTSLKLGLIIHFGREFVKIKRVANLY